MWYTFVQQSKTLLNLTQKILRSNNFFDSILVYFGKRKLKKTKQLNTFELTQVRQK